MDFDIDEFLVAENKHLFGGSNNPVKLCDNDDDDLYGPSNTFGDGFQSVSNNNLDFLCSEFKENANDKVKSWLINLETKEPRLIIDDIDDGMIPEILKDYDWIIDLEIDSQKIKKIKNLPKKLIKLSLFNNLIEDIPANELPETLEYLNISRNKIQTLQNIPSSVKELDASHNFIRGCYLLTNTNLVELSIESNFLESMPLFLRGLKKLDISQNKLKHIYNIVDTIEELDASLNELETIGKFPKSLKRINLFNNKINFISDLIDAEELEYGDFSFNNITVLPQLPIKINKVDFSANKISLVNVDLESCLDKLKKDCCIILHNNPLDKIPIKILCDSRLKHNKLDKEKINKQEKEDLNNVKFESYVEIKLKGSITV